MDPGEQNLATDFLFGNVDKGLLAQPPRVRGVRLDKMIGEGAFGIVWKGEQFEPVTRLVAVKILRMGALTSHALRRFEAEKIALARLEHPHIAHILDAGTTQEGAPYLVMEYVPGDTLLKSMGTGPFPAARALDIAEQIAGALARAHQQELAAHAAREEAALAEAAARTGEKHKATAAAALRAEALQRWRPLIIAVALVVFGGGGYSAVRGHQADLARRAEIAQLQAHFTELGEKRDAISAAREQAVAAREAAVSASATALESAELSKLEFRLAPDDLGLGYTATVKNGSSYHLESLTGSLHPLSDGADFGAESFFLCCDHATDQHGFDRGYAIAPGGKARKEQAVGIYDVQADAPERRKFASDHGLTLKEDFIGQPTMPIDALAHFDGSARWVREPRLEVSGEANVYTAEPVDFHALAEKEGDWRVMDADIAGLDAELGAIDTELEALRARLPSTSN
jgi:hypothetical protein